MEPRLSLEEARAQSRCRICGERISIGIGPIGWKDMFKELLWPVHVTLNFGEEFAHHACLNPQTTQDPEEEARK